MSEPRYTGQGTDFYYLPSDTAPDAVNLTVADTVNLAVDLNRPLLVEGEPGCGKTQLAYSIADEKRLDLVKIMVKSTSRAQDLLYRFDAFRRLQDAQNPQASKAQHIYPYLALGPLGEVIQKGRRCVVLIDEIDKADIDFPNDLLDVLDNFTFQIADLPAEEEEDCCREKGFRRTVGAGRNHADPATLPIVVITSNREKRLPEPFLRRCLYLRLRFPESIDALREIVQKNLKQPAVKINTQILDPAIKAFLAVRKAALASNAQKPPTTSELIDWIRILLSKGVRAEDLDPLRPPAWETLFKTMNDLDLYQQLLDSAKA
jgi:MoxR-like ATPase